MDHFSDRFMQFTERAKFPQTHELTVFDAIHIPGYIWGNGATEYSSSEGDIVTIL